MNQPPDSGMNTPPGYGAPQQPAGYGQPQPSGPVPNSGSYQPPPQGRSGFTRQMFNPAMYRQPGSGSWAASSLIMSLVSMFICGGLIAPIPLVLGLVGMIGNKRAKGMAFVGFILSALQVVGWVAFISLGMHLNFQSESLAEDAGKPVVAAVEQFKEDNKRVPHSLQELIDTGYLPETWERGFEDIDSNIEEKVKGKRWQDFLAYKPGEDSEWEGSPRDTKESDISIEGGFDEFSINFPNANGEPTEYQTYGLTFVGLDLDWYSTDDSAVNQNPEDAYDLTQLWDGDNTSREAMRKKRELKVMLNNVDKKLASIDKNYADAEASLDKHEKRLFEIANEKGLTRSQIKTDSDTKAWLQLIGETSKRLQITAAKKSQLKSTRNKLEVQMERLKNQVELAKLADSKEQLVELQRLLDESREALDGKEDDFFATKTEDDFADEWLDKEFG